ncbi:hypothetical protein D4R52_00105 [bacterium]|nr:MAG: hypothetical protein D4R52_00105 [bacterium]
MNIDTLDPRAEIAENETALKEVSQDLAELEIAPENLHPEFLKRLSLLAAQSEFYKHSQRMSLGLKNVLENFDSEPQTIRNTRFAAIIHDIGKTGPADAPAEAQKAFLNLYNNPTNNGSLKVGEIENSPQELEQYGAQPEMTMKDFWNSHSIWTFDNLTAYPEGINAETKVLAASHHADKKEPISNPYLMDAKEFPFALKALIAMDKTEAAYTRRNLPLPEAIASAKDIVGKNPELKDDLEFNKIFAAMNGLAKRGNFLISELPAEKEMEQRAA